MSNELVEKRGFSPGQLGTGWRSRHRNHLERHQLPVLLAQQDSYEVASQVHDLTVKTRPDDKEKISLIQDIIAKNVDLNGILKAIGAK